MKVELNIPEGLHEITLEQYQQYIELTEKLQDNPEGLKQAAISCFCRVPMSTVRFIRAVDVDAIYNQFIEYFKQKPPMQPIIKIGDEVFGFEPDLQNMDYGAYLDLDSNITTWANYHKALAVMYRPVVKNKGNKYQIQQYEGTANYSEVMKHVTLDVVFGANVFFYRLGNDLLNALMYFLHKQTKTKEFQTLAKKDNLLKDGDGIKQSIYSLREMLQSLTKLHENRCLSVLPY